MIVRWILFAVFFTLLLVVGNTMAQSVRERVPELAVLKTLGFSDGSVLGFVLAEADTCCAPGYTTLSLRNRSADTPAFLFIADEAPLHRKLGVFESRD